MAQPDTDAPRGAADELGITQGRTFRALDIFHSCEVLSLALSVTGMALRIMPAGTAPAIVSSTALASSTDRTIGGLSSSGVPSVAQVPGRFAFRRWTGRKHVEANFRAIFGTPSTNRDEPQLEVEKGWVPEVHDSEHRTAGEPPGRDAHLLTSLATRFASRHRLRIDPGRPAAAAMGVAALVAVVIACWWVLLDRPQASAITPNGASAAVGSSSSSSSPVPSRQGVAAVPSPAASRTVPAIVVDVVGKVRTPGIYRLPAGSRVDDALVAAGGALAGTDLSSLNLARKVADGEQIAVAVAGAPDAGGATSSTDGSGGFSVGPVDLNSASEAQLDGLPGVGPVLAQHIIDWRTAHGRFASVDQLREVSGIGQAKYADLRPLVTI